MLTPGWLAGNERDGDADVFALGQQLVGIEEAEGEADQRRLGAERDVALVPRQADAEHFLAVVHALRDGADVAHRGSIGAGGRAGQREAGNLFTTGKPRQIVVLLFVGAVLFDQFAWPEGIGDHDDGDDVGRARGDLAEDERLSLGGEAEAAMLFRNKHAEEAVLLGERPDRLRDLALGVTDLPVVDQTAQLFGRAVEEGLLFRRQDDRGNGAQLGPVGRAGEEFGIEADGAGVERLLFGVGHLGKDFLDGAEGRLNQQRAAQGRYRQRAQKDRGQPGQHAQESGRRLVAGAVGQRCLPDEGGDGDAERPDPDGGSPDGKAHRGDQNKQKKDCRCHGALGLPTFCRSDVDIQNSHAAREVTARSCVFIAGHVTPNGRRT